MSGAPPRLKPDSPARTRALGSRLESDLSERQAMVLHALVAAYVGQAGPVSSTALSHLMPKTLSPASIRNTLAELHEAGLIAKAHAVSISISDDRHISTDFLLMAQTVIYVWGDRFRTQHVGENRISGILDFVYVDSPTLQQSRKPAGAIAPHAINQNLHPGAPDLFDIN